MSLKLRLQWTADLREALAVSVMKREKLWKKFPVVSHDTELRAALWAEVADELTEQFGVYIDTEEMKKTWKNLKDNYWRIRKMYESDPLKPRVWRFYQCLRFLERVNIDESKLNIHQPKPSSSKGNSIDTRISQILVEARQMQEHDHDGSGQVSSSEGDSNQGNDRKRIRKHPFRVHMNPSLVQISIPEIDRYINTRQKSSEGVEIYSIPAEHIEDALTVELSEIWRETEAEYMEYIEQRLDDQTTSKQVEPDQQAPHGLNRETDHRLEKVGSSRNSRKRCVGCYQDLAMREDSATAGKRAKRVNTRSDAKVNDALPTPDVEHLAKYDTRSPLGEQREAKLLELVQSTSERTHLSDDLCLAVASCASNLRGVYHQAALSIFVKERLPPGQLQALVEAYDNFVYGQRPNKDVILRVIKACDPKEQSAFATLFTILQNHGDKLQMHRPEDLCTLKGSKTFSEKEIVNAIMMEERIRELMAIAEGNKPMDDEARNLVIICATKLRGVFHQAALTLFIKQDMPSGRLQTLLDAYDDFVYSNLPNKESISKVINVCEPSKQDAFEAFFKILERDDEVRDLLILRRADDRWAQIDLEARKNIDLIFAKRNEKDQDTKLSMERRTSSTSPQSENETRRRLRRKRKPDTEPTIEIREENPRELLKALKAVERQVKEHSSALESTKALLDMVEPGDDETREELETTLKSIVDMYQKAIIHEQALDQRMKELRARPKPKVDQKMIELQQHERLYTTRSRRSTRFRGSMQESSLQSADANELFTGPIKTESRR
ncbi:hypothetical protein Q1695_008259 [Nippostrongylus brasiliensis]|nr:hypothetical protein Q1695_008259 [Nippostrongylus brasiliensis]